MWRVAYWFFRIALHSPKKEVRNLFTNLLLDSIDALPIRDILKVSEAGELLLNGEPLSVEMSRLLSSSAQIALDNKAIKILREHVERTAVIGSLHNGDLPEKIMFFRAAIWYGQQLETHLKLLSQRSEPSRLSDYEAT